MALSLTGCNSPATDDNREQYIEEVIAVEQAFNDLAASEGLAKAFGTYAAEDAVIQRGGKLIISKDSIAAWYSANANPDAQLSWAPDHIEVSHSGDLASTYGSFVYTVTDSTGTKQERKGTFHTVWKRQADGSWKFIWD